MQYRRVGNRILLRVDYDEELTTAIENVCRKENIKLASVAGVGAFKSCELGVYDVPTRNYEVHRFDKFFELLSIMGNVTQKEGDYYGHYHVTLSDHSCAAFGGHLVSAIIGGTSEIFIDIIDELHVDRKVDDMTGINIWDFDN